MIVLLGCGITHPQARELMPYPWTGRQEREFRTLTTVLRLAYRGLPAALTDTALTRNRRRYHKLVSRYRGMGLTTFVLDPRFAPRRPTTACRPAGTGSPRRSGGNPAAGC